MSEENFNNGTNFNTPSENAPEGGKGMAIASMVLGILSIVCCWSWYICLPCGIIGLILGIVYNKKNGSIGMSKAGIICSIIGLVLTVLFIVAIGAILASMGIALGGLQ